MAEPRNLTVRVSGVPDPHRIRAAIADALAGRALGAGPEAEIARAVARDVASATARGRT